MHRAQRENSWYGFSVLGGDWASINFDGYIESSIGRIELPIIGGVKDFPLYLVGARYNGKFLMGGQSQNGHGTLFYTDGEWFQLSPISFGVSPCAFSQDGRFFYYVTGSLNASYRDNETGILTPFETPFYTNGIRAIIPPANKIILGNTTQYSAVYNLYEYIDFENGLVIGQGANGLVAWYNGTRYLIEPGGTFFIRAMYDGFNLALDTVKQVEKQNVSWFLNTAELVNFPVADRDSIIAISKPCWLGWFEFNQPPTSNPPGNALVKIRYDESGAITRLDNSRFATWVDGSTVEEIEAKVQASLYPCVVYWDGRVWPRWPNIRSQDWICVYGYCFLDETLSVFEVNLRALIDTVPSSYPRIVVNCQCYTSNAVLTKDLSGLVPVYARIAHDYPRINFLTAFSDQDRPTGLNDNSFVRPYWQELFNGITGEPGMSDPDILPEDIFNDLVRLRPNYPTPMGNNAAKLLNEVALLHPGWGLESKSGGTVCPQPSTGITCGCDILRLPNSGYDVLGDAENEAIPIRGVRGPADPSRFVRPIESIPTPGISLIIHDYDKLVHRSDPKGLLVRFDVDSAYPVTEITLDLEGDGEPAIPIMFLPQVPVDGRYVRALAFKPTVNGAWILRVTARDSSGAEKSVTGPVGVTVTS